MQKKSAQLLKKEDHFMYYIYRIIFSLFFYFKEERISAHCIVCPQYYSTTVDLVKQLFTGRKQELWLSRIDNNMRHFWEVNSHA